MSSNAYTCTYFNHAFRAMIIKYIDRTIIKKEIFHHWLRYLNRHLHLGSKVKSIYCIKLEYFYISLCIHSIQKFSLKGVPPNTFEGNCTITLLKSYSFILPVRNLALSHTLYISISLSRTFWPTLTTLWTA